MSEKKEPLSEVSDESKRRGPLIESLYPWLLAAIGGFIGAALLLPTKLGEAIIQYRVGKTLEAFKAEQAQVLEGLKADLSHLGDRGRRSNELEFESINLVWRAFVKAWLSTNTCVSQMITMPDFANLTEDEVRSFAEGSGLSDREQASLLQASDRRKEYVSILSWEAVTTAATDIYQARLLLRERRIFMPSTMTKKFDQAIEKMSAAQVQKRLSLQHSHIRGHEWGKAQADWMENCMTVFEELAEAANERLFRTERTNVAADRSN